MPRTEQLDLFGNEPLSAPPASLPANARWREAAAKGTTIGFVLRRSRRRSIGLIINDDGLQITAPHWVTLRQIDAAVVEKAGWILDKLAQRRARQAHQATANTCWHDGGGIPYLGQRIVLKLDGARGQTLFDGDCAAPVEGDRLWLALPHSADHDRVRDTVHAWLQRQAAARFETRLRHFLDLAALQMRQWRLSTASTRWGSCNSRGDIRLNWRLIHFSPETIDYVIAHEVAHLRHMNHSSDFWREVERIFPDYANVRNALRQYDPASLPLL